MCRASWRDEEALLLDAADVLLVMIGPFLRDGYATALPGSQRRDSRMEWQGIHHGNLADPDGPLAVRRKR